MTFGTSLGWISARRLPVEAGEETVQGPGRRASRAASRSRSSWSRDGPSNRPSKQRAEVKPGAPGDYRQAAAGCDVRDGLAGQPGKLPGREQLVGIDDVDQVVRNAAALRQRELGGADVEMAKDLEGVAVDHLTVEFFCNQQAPGRSCPSLSVQPRQPVDDPVRQRVQGRGSPVFTSTDVVSPFCRKSPVYNEKVISTLLGASLAVERKNIPCFA